MTAMTAAFQSWLGKSHLSESLALDVMRLRSVARALGEIRLVVPFLGLRQELRGANKRLSRRLLDSEPKGRSAMVDAFRAAERELPVEVRTPQGTTVAPLLDQVRQNGCADLGPIFTDDQLADIHAHLGTMPVLLAHDAHITTEAAPSLDQVPAGHNYACYKYLDLWSCPHILEAAIRDEIIDLAQGYLGCTPTLYSVNAFWSLPNRTPHKATQLFHRDLEDARSIVVFTLLTPVAEPHEGAHYYVERSHDLHSLEQLMRAKGAAATTSKVCLPAMAPLSNPMRGGGSMERRDGSMGQRATPSASTATGSIAHSFRCRDLDCCCGSASATSSMRTPTR
jgi:hypothetical protein